MKFENLPENLLEKIEKKIRDYNLNAKLSNLIKMITKEDLKRGKNLKLIQQEIFVKMKNYPAFLFLIKTNYNKLIGLFVDSKYENTKGMKC